MDDILEQAANNLLNEDNPFEIEHYLGLFETAVEPNRFALLHALFTADEGMSAAELREVIGKSGHGLHQHLNKLVDKNLVTNWKKNNSEKLSTYSYYEITGTGHVIHDAFTHILERERDATDHFRSE